MTGATNDILTQSTKERVSPKIVIRCFIMEIFSHRVHCKTSSNDNLACININSFLQLSTKDKILDLIGVVSIALINDAKESIS